MAFMILHEQGVFKPLVRCMSFLFNTTRLLFVFGNEGESLATRRMRFEVAFVNLVPT
jgi:hypothetical protein